MKTQIAHISVISEDSDAARKAAENIYGCELTWTREGSEWFGKNADGAQVSIVNMEAWELSSGGGGT